MSSLDQSHRDQARVLGEPKIPLIIILGPTAVGKTELAIQLAECLGGEIVSADSRLFYRGMDIGTAKPTSGDRLRVPHHLIDVANPDETWSLALFQLEANLVIRRITRNHHLPIMVGGTGQFIRAVIEGWRIPSVTPDPHLREVLIGWSSNIGPVAMHSKLAILDPLAASSIDPTNVRRTVRALEVILSTGRRFSAQKERGRMLYQCLLIGLTRPRTELYQRIDDRITKMLASGFVEEVRRLLDQGYTPDLPTLSAIGYREVVAYIQGRITLQEAIVLVRRRTRTFVRRQANWFKENDPDIHWFQVNDRTVEEMEKLAKNWLASIEKPGNPFDFLSI
jgi:tRNA dimethylallyltransferase